MRIGLNLLYLIPTVVGGTQTYAVSLIKSLAAIDQENEYLVFLNQESAELELTDAPNFHRVVCGFRAIRRLVRYAWEQLILPFQLRYHKIDLIHSLGYVGPLLSPCPSIVTIPDLNYVALENTVPKGKRLILQFFSTRAARRAMHVITISNFSKQEICRVLKLRPSRVAVTHLASKANGFVGDSESWEKLKLRYAILEPYIVAFGGRAMHKNIPRLTRAFGQLAGELPHNLVLMGHLPPDVDLASTSDDLRGRIIPTGYVPEEHILPLLSHADLFVLPSLYEGFGLPVVEAQQAGVAVACSAAGSLPEVAGKGAVFFDPLSIDDMSHAIRLCLSETKLRTDLIWLGRENLLRFSWDKTARETLSVYQQVYQSRA